MLEERVNCDVEEIEEECEDDYVPERDPAHRYGKGEFCSLISKKLRKQKSKKEVSVPGQVFHISDDYGDIKDLYIKGKNGEVFYNAQDVSTILEALMEAAAEILKDGGSISLRGFGVLELHKHGARAVIHPATKERIIIPEHYSPRFSPGKELIISANIYDAEQKKQHAISPDEEEQPLLPEDKIRELEEEGIAVLDF